MSSRSATVLVIFIVAVFAFCLASVFASMTGPISIFPNETESGGILDNLSAITDDDSIGKSSYNYQDYNYQSDDSSNEDYQQVETTTDDSNQVETTSDDSKPPEKIVDKSSLTTPSDSQVESDSAKDSSGASSNDENNQN